MSSLPQILREKLAASPSGRLPFAQVMDLALYHPDHGYYGAGPRKIGRQGDFYTSVSVGPLFGKLLAMYALQEWQALGEPEDFTLIEQGAHDGQLAEDVLSALEGSPLRYLIVEPNPKYRESQFQRLGDRVQWVESLAVLKNGPKHGFFLCNELPDAFQCISSAGTANAGRNYSSKPTAPRPSASFPAAAPVRNSRQK